MSATILTLNTVDSKGIKTWAKQKQKEAETYAKIAEKLAGIPGVDDLKEIVKDKIDEKVDEFFEDAKDYIIAKALYLAYQWLDSEEDDRKRQPSDLYDMMTILSMGYPNFYNTFLECEKREIQV